MNSVNISGRLVYAPEAKKTQSGNTFLSSRIAVSRNDKEKNTDFFSIKAWGTTADFIGKYFHKGDPIEITGKLRTDEREKDGAKIYETYVLVSEVNFVMSRKTEAERAPTAPANPMKDIPVPKKEEKIDPSTLPFEV